MVEQHLIRELKDSTRAVGEMWEQYLVFEEDCAAPAFFADRPELWDVGGQEIDAIVDSEMATLAFRINRGYAAVEEIASYFLKIAKVWFPEAYGVKCYFCEQGRCGRHNTFMKSAATWTRNSRKCGCGTKPEHQHENGEGVQKTQCCGGSMCCAGGNE